MAYIPIITEDGLDVLITEGSLEDIIIESSDQKPTVDTALNRTVLKEKRYFVKFFDEDGNYVGTENDVTFDSFRKTVNGGLSNCNVRLARQFDDFKEGSQIDFMHELQIWVVDKESGAEGIQIYSGFIDAIEPFVGGGSEGVKIRAVGYVTRLGDVMYKDGTTITIAQNSQDPSDIIKDVIDKYQATNPNYKITYTADSIDDTGNSASNTYIMQDSFEAIEKTRQLGPSDWYWYVDATNVLEFKSKPVVATHKFTFGKEVRRIEVKKNVTDIVNQLVFWNGLQEDDDNFLCRSYSDTDSIDAYGLKMMNKTDSRIVDSGTMDLWGDAFIASRKDPNVKVILQIVDSNGNARGYDIESIEPGDTCKVINLPPTSTTLGDNMVITDVLYTLGGVTLQLEDLRQSLGRKFSDVVKEMRTHLYNDGPDDYTAT